MGVETSGRSAKDYAEHLRTVHFTLLAVCFGLLVVTSSRAPDELATAHRQIKDLVELDRSWREAGLENETQRQVDAALAAWRVKRQGPLQIPPLRPEAATASAERFSTPTMIEIVQTGPPVPGDKWPRILRIKVVFPRAKLDNRRGAFSRRASVLGPPVLWEEAPLHRS